MQSVIITQNQAGQRLDKFLKKYLPEAGSSFLYKMLRKKNITLNDKKAQGNEMLAVGDRVCFFFSEETFEKFSGRTATETECYRKAYTALKGITVLHEDTDVLLLNKPAGILTQKAQPSDLSLNEWLVGYLLESGAVSENDLHSFHPSVCNRLDRNTSGIVLCGKTLYGSQLLSRLIKERTVRKFYRTICAGKLDRTEMLEGYLVKDAASNRVTISAAQVPLTENASYIKTFYHPLNATRDFTLLEVELITGKPHQIRAHLASIGHPILGDYKYGDSKGRKQLQLKFQLLHAYRLEFPKDTSIPENLRGRVITAPYPALFEAALVRLGLS